MFTIQNSERLELTATLVKEAVCRLKLVSNESGLLWWTEGGSKLVPGQKIPFWASFLNYTGSVKRTANLADVFIPKGESCKKSKNSKNPILGCYICNVVNSGYKNYVICI